MMSAIYSLKIFQSLVFELLVDFNTKSQTPLDLILTNGFGCLKLSIIMDNMRVFIFSANHSLFTNYLHDRTPYVSYGGARSAYINYKISAPRMIRLGPALQLIFENNFRLNRYGRNKHADDKTLF